MISPLVAEIFMFENVDDAFGSGELIKGINFNIQTVLQSKIENILEKKKSYMYLPGAHFFGT